MGLKISMRYSKLLDR